MAQAAGQSTTKTLPAHDPALTRRTALALAVGTLTAASATLVASGKPALPVMPDAIAFAIEDHRAAYLAFSAALRVDDGGDGPDVDRTCNAELAARDRLAQAIPETLTGAVAAIRYVVGYYNGEHDHLNGRTHELFGGEDDFVMFLSGIASCLARHLAMVA